MSAPPRKPCRRHTFSLEIDPDQILLDLEDEYGYESTVNNSAGNNASDDGGGIDVKDKEVDKQSRPPRQPSRRSTVRVALEPDQLLAFEEWRRRHAAILQDDVVEIVSDDPDWASSVMDLTVDSTILSWVDPRTSSAEAAEDGAPPHPTSGCSLPPKQPRRRSTLIVTLGQPQGPYALGDDSEYDESALDDTSYYYGGGRPDSINVHDVSSANGASFSEDSHATSVFVELFCKKVLEEQRRSHAAATADPGSPVPRRRGGRRALPSPRASLRLRGPVRHLRQLMPELDRIESVGTVLDADVVEEVSSPPSSSSHPNSRSLPRGGEQPPVQPHRRQSAAAVGARPGSAERQPTPENSTRRKSRDLIRDVDGDCNNGEGPFAIEETGKVVVAWKHDTHPVLPVRALSHQSSAASSSSSSGTGSSSPRVSGRRLCRPCPDPIAASQDIDDAPDKLSTTHMIDDDDDDDDDDEDDDDDDGGDSHSEVAQEEEDDPDDPTGLGGGPTVTEKFSGTPTFPPSLSAAGLVTKDKAMRESLQTVATEVSWDSHDGDDDDDDDGDDGDNDGDGHYDDEPAVVDEIPDGIAPRRIVASHPDAVRGSTTVVTSPC